MARHIAFLRAINVGGHTVKMDVLAQIFAGLGFANVDTFIASGNVIFEAGGTSATLETRVERELEAKLGYAVATFIRSPQQVQHAANCAPFPAAQMAAAGALNVAFLKAPLPPDALRALKALESEIDAFSVVGSEMYWLCKVKQSESKFSNAVFERTLKVQATFRGISTVQKLAAKYCA